MAFCPKCGKRFPEFASADPEIKTSKRKIPLWLVLVCALAVLLAAVCCALFLRSLSKGTAEEAAPEAVSAMEAAAENVSVPDEPVSIPELAQSVLYVEGYDGNDEFVNSASGFLIDDGVLVTNYHVISDVCTLFAATADYSEVAAFDTLLAYDEEIDLAILRSADELDVSVLPLANSKHVRQGDRVYAVGYPLGLANTLTEGIVGAVYDMDGYQLLQISAPISHGNSGGAVLNESGEVVGVACMYLTDGQNLNYAIASNDVKRLYRVARSEMPLADFYFQNGGEGAPPARDSSSQSEQETAPRQTAPPERETPPRQASPQQTAPRQTTPQQTSPQQTAPRQTTPETPSPAPEEAPASEEPSTPEQQLSLAQFQGIWRVVSTSEWELNRIYIDIPTMTVFSETGPGWLRSASLSVSDDGGGLVCYKGSSNEIFFYIDSVGLLYRTYDPLPQPTVLRKESGVRLDVSILRARVEDYDSKFGLDGAELTETTD